MRLGGRQVSLSPPVSIVYLTIFFRSCFAPCHENMFGYLLSNDRGFFLSLSVICVNWEKS